MSEKFRILTWDEFDQAVKHIAENTPPAVRGVCGQARGGLPLAVALSHELRVPMVKHAGNDVMWVDDIVDSGKTLRDKQAIFGHFAAWVVRKPDPKVIHDQVIEGSWIVFPWENINDAEREFADYEKSRNIPS
jgi:hypoxanthine phosphoribosyltransferase